MFPSDIEVDGNSLSSQGFAIYGDYAFNFFDKGYCQVYRINPNYTFTLLNAFKLGSYTDENHANTAMFAPNIVEGNKFPYLYLGGIYGNKCYVERIDENGSELLQTITINLEDENIIDKTALQVCIGGDGYLWYVHAYASGHKFLFGKFNVPDVTLGDVTLTDADVIEKWVADENFQGSGVDYGAQFQGCKIYGDRVYWSFGASDYVPGKRLIRVWNNKTHKLETVVDLSTAIPEELEDFDFYDDMIIMSIHGGSGVYLIRFN